jgi:hypothetical protein
MMGRQASAVQYNTIGIVVVLLVILRRQREGPTAVEFEQGMLTERTLACPPT